MMRTALHYFAGGHLGQYEDWWYLIQNEGEEPYVEHEWDHVSVGSGGKNEGTRRYSIDEARTALPGGAAKKMEEILKARGT